MKKNICFFCAVIFCFCCVAEFVNAESLSGKVRAVNAKHGFIVINLGLKNDVETGMVFFVYRKDKLVSKVKVEEVFDSMSSCTVLHGWDDGKIKLDDGVVEE